jgi:thiol-disulfide isomerase/thioredoxin
MLNIEFFSSPGCGKCGHAKVMLAKLVDELGVKQINWREVDILKEIDYAVKIGVLSTPAIAFNGELIFTGMPSNKNLRTQIVNALEAEQLTQDHRDRK